MKLIVVLSIAEHQERVATLLHAAGVKRFSTFDITGYKRRKEDATLNWFGAEAQEAKTDSIVLFSFALEETAHRVVEEIERCNENTRNPFPVHAFILDVEQYSKFL